VISLVGTDAAIVPRPFLKWPGGKQWLMPLFSRELDVSHGTYREPFLGGGAAFFATQPRRAVLSDANSELIATYRVVRDAVEPLIQELGRYPHERAFFEEMRSSKPDSDVKRAARFIYLNKTAFNGMYRVNRQGEFNVPFGRFVRPGICQPERLRVASLALHSATLSTGDFEEVLRIAAPGDLVYLDPPYVTGHHNNGFVRYNERLFSWADQCRLAALATRLADMGVRVVVTNASHEAITSLYPRFLRYSLQRHSLIGGAVGYRGSAFESIMSSEELPGLTPDAP
jgi:DNA adenine methylase